MAARHYRWFAWEGQLLMDGSGWPVTEPIDGSARPDDFYIGYSASFGVGAHFWLVPQAPTALPAGAEPVGLRDCIARYSGEQFDLAGRALQIEHWWRTHRYCGRCGGALTGPALQQRLAAELVRHCPRCETRYYPRLSPCVIALVRRGEYCLLAHHRRARRPVYTTLAGFVEAGERVEQTVHREIGEEVNIRVEHLRYVDSQSWPFPGQLMLGFYADYHSGDIRPQPDEILAADWFHYRALPVIPPEGTIARRLIDGFVRDCERATEHREQGTSI